MFTLPGIGAPVLCPRCGQPHCGRWEIHKGQREWYCTTTWRTISPTLLNEQARRLGLPLRPPPSLSR
jgi:hypothetical protein